MISQLQKIEKWVRKYSRTMLRYRDGFFEIPVYAESPVTMEAGLLHTPFITHNKDRNLTIARNWIVHGKMYMFPIEDGLYLMLNVNLFKQNVAFRFTYEINNLSEYYSLSFIHVEHETASKYLILNGQNRQNDSWVFYKPKVENKVYYLKGVRNYSINIFFTKKWLNRSQLAIDEPDVLKHIYLILANEEQYLALPFYNKELLKIIHEVKQKIEASSTTQTLLDSGFVNQAKVLTASFLSEFSKNFQTYQPDSLAISNHSKLYNIELLLNERILEPFPGVAFLAACVSMSPTKLKADFKKKHGCSLGNFFIIKKMEYAKTMLLTNEAISIKELAFALGYNNFSKFSATFKKHFGCLPSQLKNKTNKI